MIADYDQLLPFISFYISILSFIGHSNFRNVFEVSIELDLSLFLLFWSFFHYQSTSLALFTILISFMIFWRFLMFIARSHPISGLVVSNLDFLNSFVTSLDSRSC